MKTFRSSIICLTPAAAFLLSLELLLFVSTLRAQDMVLPPALKQAYERGELKIAQVVDNKSQTNKRQLRVAGEGARGLVYVTESTPPLAFKTFSHAEMLGQELKAYQTIGSNPNIVACYGELELDVHGKPEGGLAMELLSRGTLAKLGLRLQTLRKKETISEEKRINAIRFAFRDLLLGLQAVHSHGMIHCDVKGANVMVAEDFTIKIIDVGGAVPKDGYIKSYTNEFADFGLMKEKANEKFDIWSAGQLLHELVMGQTFLLDSDTLKEPAKRQHPPPWIAACKTWMSDKSNRAINASKAKELGEPYAAYVELQNLLLHPDPAQRPTAEQALKLPFLQKIGPDENSAAYKQSLFEEIFAAPFDPSDSDSSNSTSTEKTN